MHSGQPGDQASLFEPQPRSTQRPQSDSDRQLSFVPGLEAQRQSEQRIRLAILGALPDTERRVAETVTLWNGVLREALRAETGLKLKLDGHRYTVPVKLDDGLPASFTDFLAVWNSPFDWVLELRRPQLEAALGGVRALAKDPEFIRHRAGAGQFDQHIDAVRTTAHLLSELLDAKPDVTLPPAGSIRGRDDALGAYNWRTGEVRLFWVVLGAHAAFLKIAVEALTIVVLAHELAHAYTHLGVDMDGRRWETEAFGGADLNITEGLAEFYTELVCTTRPHAKLPNLSDAYDALLWGSSGPYVVHKTWERLGPQLGEAVRLAMLAARRRPIKRYAEFEQVLAESCQQLG